MNVLSTACGLFVAVLLWPVVVSAQGTQGNSGQRNSVGAPQVLEIPIPQTDVPYQEDYDSPPQAYDQEYGYDQNSAYRYDQNYDDNTQQAGFPSGLPELESPIGGGSRTYLGVLYATTEEGPEGVKVLSIVPGSPADKAGFEGANTPPEERSDLLKAAIVVLAMSPAGPFAIPLAIAHDMYTNRNAPGDLIVAIDNKPTRDAQEFTEIMRSYKPGDTVAFSIIRAGKPMNISVQLEEEPL